MAKIKKKELIVFLFILIIALFLRLFRIADYMTFLGDEGRDAIIVRRFLLYFDIILIGPGTSIGNMYLGPLYYYLIAPALLLFNFSPVGPSVLVALIGVATVALVYLIAKQWFNTKAAIIASFFYAISPVVIIYSRSSWNPNVMPFFALLVIYSLYKIWKEFKFFWFIVLGVSFAFCLQSHYLALLVSAVILPVCLLTLRNSCKKNKKLLKKFIVYSFISLLLFSLLMSPLLIFDIRHGFRNFSALKTFFLERQTTVSAKPWSGGSKVIPIAQKSLTRLVGGKNQTAGTLILVSLILYFGFLLFTPRSKIKLKIDSHANLLLFFWLLFSFQGLSLYKQEIYDHYYGFFFPMPFILLGGISSVFTAQYKFKGKVITYLALFVLLIINLQDNPLKYPPNRQLERTVTVANKIKQEAVNLPFNLAVIAERNYEDAYQYFLEKDNTKITEIDPQKSNLTITKQLFVVCELQFEKCDPTHNAKAEVANFGWSEIDSYWNIEGVTLFKLIHTNEEKN